jgi:chromosome segregation protein
MPYIKKLVMKGFKSFPRETEILLDKSMNVIVGPNGSGKSNITDAICFVLGRLSIKSMRAAKSSNLIFAGTKQYKPSNEASVKIIFDNFDNKFSLQNKEIIIERLVRSSGQGIYRINNEAKTRQEVLELLAQAGIDPYGFNIVLQGEIDSIVKMHSEERRKVIEEVAGISIYELRKEKSLHELEKTEEKLKEVQATLRERTSYLKNLEEERKQALKFKKLEETIKRCKASILKRKIDEKKKEISSLESRKESQEKAKSQEKEKSDKIQEKIDKTQKEIERIQAIIQKASGIEQEQLNNQISDLRAELAGLNANKEDRESRIEETESRKNRLNEEIKKIEEEIPRLRKEFPQQSKKHLELEKKKQEFSELEKSMKNFYNLKEKLNALKQISGEKERHFQNVKNEASFILKELDRVSQDLVYKELELCRREITKLKNEQVDSEKKLASKEKELLEQEKLVSVYNSEIANTEKIKKQVEKLDICPLCKSKITPEHITQVYKEADEKISEFKEKLGKLNPQETAKEIASLKENLIKNKNNLSKAETDLIKLENVNEKKENLKRISQEEANLKTEIISLEKEKKAVENKLLGFENVEEKYDSIFIEIQEISSRTQENLNAELEIKERRLLDLRNQLKQNEREKEDIEEQLKDIENDIGEKEKNLEEKEEDELELEKKFQKFIEQKTGLEKQVHENNSQLYEQKNKIALIENEINNLKIELARINAEKDNLDLDFNTYQGVEVIILPILSLEQKLNETQVEMQTLGSINLRALEVYDKMKEEYDAVAEKVTILDNEKLEILKIIEEIDKKKRKTFSKTLEAINSLFNRNFTQLSTKGQAFLEVENEEDMFAGGLDIVIKVGKGKYFDVTSLSGGEQTLVALSLIFAIQEYKPYSFYIFDEVDAALDKRNSERLALLIKKYMKTGQYIIVTHNDAIITESSILYGVSMQEGISKILSLEI